MSTKRKPRPRYVMLTDGGENWISLGRVEKKNKFKIEGLTAGQLLVFKHLLEESPTTSFVPMRQELLTLFAEWEQAGLITPGW